MTFAAFLVFAGRVLLGGTYVFAGIRHFTIIGPGSAAVAARGLPYPKLVFLGGSVFEAICGALLACGIYPAIMSLALFVFTIAASILLLDFWNLNGEARIRTFNNVASNVALLGGLLVSAGTSM